MNDVKSGLALKAAALLAATLSTFAASDAQADPPELKIVGYELQNIEEPPGARLIAKTDTGEGIPPERVEFKTLGRVIRVTYTDVPMIEELGIKHDFDVDAITRVEKGYAIDDHTEAFVRLRFDDKADTALENHKIYTGYGGIVVDFPFGGQLEPPQLADAEASEGGEDEATNDEGDADGSATNGSGEDGATNGSDVVDGEGATNGATNDVDVDAEGDDAAAGDDSEADDTDAEAGGTNGAAAGPAGDDNEDGAAAPPPSTTEGTPAPAETTPAPSSINWDDPFGPLALMLLAFLALLSVLAIWAFFRSRKETPAVVVSPTEGALSPTDVQLLARYSLGEGSELLVVRVLGEVFVIGNGPLTLLRRMSAEPMGDVWGAVDDIQQKLRALLLQMQQAYEPEAMPTEEVGAIVEKLEGEAPIDFQEVLRKRQASQSPDPEEDDDSQGATGA